MPGEVRPARAGAPSASVGAGEVTAWLRGCSGVELHKIKHKRWIENIPPVSTQGVVSGINEIKGEVASLPREKNRSTDL